MIGLDPNAPLPQQPAQTPLAPTMSVGGIMPIMSQAQVEAEERRKAQQGQDQPGIQGLAEHVRKMWTVCRQAKEMTIEQRMLSNIRIRRGEYDPAELAEIRKQGGSEIFMMVGSTKARAAGSWLRDVIVAVRDEKPWTIKPTPIPTLPPNVVEEVRQQGIQMVAQAIMQMGGQLPPEDTVREMLEMIHDEFLSKMRDEAAQKADRMEDKMEDQLIEGGFLRAVNEFIDDLTTFPTAILKGPIVRRKPRMQWVPDPENPGDYTCDYAEELVLEWERVDPLYFYPHPALTHVNEPLPTIERHRLTRTGLNELIGVEGYDDNAIRAVLDEYGRGGLHEWIRVDTAKAEAEGRSTTHVLQNPEGTIDALQYFGPVQGKMLKEWGLKDIPDEQKDYHCEVWLIGRWVIKASLNYDPLGRKPYYCTSYERVPGAFWGNSVIDLCSDSQKMCNAAARAIANNMGISSGPQAFVNVDRLPNGEDITEMYPWKIWQVTNDPTGAQGDPVKFFQPQSNSQELMTIFQQFSVRADEDTGVPRYMTGESPTGGAGRTASGLSMLLGNASKTIKQVVNNVDLDIITPVLERLYHYNMKYSDDPELKGDVNIVARGAVSIMLKESAQVRRNEFLGMIGQNPILANIVGPEGIAELVREAAKTLDMPNVDRLVPPPEKLKLMAKMQQAMQAQQPPAAATPPGVNNGNQNLVNGAPATDNFTPAPQ